MTSQQVLDLRADLARVEQDVARTEAFIERANRGDISVYVGGARLDEPHQGHYDLEHKVLKVLNAFLVSQLTLANDIRGRLSAAEEGGR